MQINTWNKFLEVYVILVKNSIIKCELTCFSASKITSVINICPKLITVKLHSQQYLVGMAFDCDLSVMAKQLDNLKVFQECVSLAQNIETNDVFCNKLLAVKYLKIQFEMGYFLPAPCQTFSVKRRRPKCIHETIYITQQCCRTWVWVNGPAQALQIFYCKNLLNQEILYSHHKWKELQSKAKLKGDFIMQT